MYLCFFLLQYEIHNLLKLFTKIENPIYISLFITFVIIITTIFFIKYVIIPKERQFQHEKEQLELKNIQLLALFSELNPDPLIRLNLNGEIIQMNNAAKLLMHSENIIGKHISILIPAFINNSIFMNADSIPQIHDIKEKKFSVYIKRIPEMQIIFLFLRDITEITDYQAKLKEFSIFSQKILEEERERIAYELHDSIGQNLSLSRILFYNLLKKYCKGIEHEEIKSLMNIINSAINELKNISFNLKPRVLDEMGLAPAVIALCDNISPKSNLKIKSDIKGKVTRLPSYTETNLYRIVQEAINNVIKHAHATECTIRLEYDTTVVKLIIADDGIGINNTVLLQNNKKNSLGLFNMKQRVDNLNGKFKIETVPKKGTIIFIEIPFEYFIG